METIKSSSEISALFKQGKRFTTPYLTVLVLKDEEQHDQSGRVVFIAGKKQGNAVWRNRAKRRMRAAFEEIDEIILDCDICFLAKNRINDVSFDEITDAMRKALKRAEVL